MDEQSCHNCSYAKWYEDTEERKAKNEKVLGSCEYHAGLIGIILPSAAKMCWYHIEPDSGTGCPTWQAKL